MTEEITDTGSFQYTDTGEVYLHTWITKFPVTISSNLLLHMIALEITHAPPRARSPDQADYGGELGELPDVWLATLDPNQPPSWFAILAHELELPPKSDLDTMWAGVVHCAKIRAMGRELHDVASLFDHFNIEVKNRVGLWDQPENPWYRLSMALAREHVPAFQTNRALQEQGRRRAAKPCKLDAYGTACLYLAWYLEEKSEERPLTDTEMHFAKTWANELTQRKVRPRTIRDLRTQLLDAHDAYWAGQANDFQRQFVEQASDLIFDMFSELEEAQPAALRKSEAA